ncbi:MAG TPA: DinB family protein [Longimicrobiales bacterium]|nr:DinB family protein [Longimicrobiales bacterium]
MRSRHAMLFSALVLLGLLTLPRDARAQDADPLRDELLMHFEGSMTKFISLAKAMPADKYTWAPGEGVMQVGHVFMHVAHYNYAYPSDNMGVPAPAGVNLDTMESVRDKAQVVSALEQSHAYVRDAVRRMSAEDLRRTTELYGRDVARYAVLVQLVAHMNEHLGQSIAYARMNGIVPPWSR